MCHFEFERMIEVSLRQCSFGRLISPIMRRGKLNTLFRLLEPCVVLILFILLARPVFSQNPLEKFTNPILPGFHPDPSICRVENDYYLVNSSFNWFPGIPIFHSKDLVNWEQIGYVLNRASQLNMVTPGNGGGIWAPTIRFHKGKFYVIVTGKQCINDCNCGDNFYVTATNPEGPWSDPIYVKDAPGIDPTIFFDDDGKTWYLGSTHEIGPSRRWPSEDRIYIAEIDLATGKLTTEPIVLTSGFASNAKFAEGPHLYKIKDKYLLLIAEGGTWNNHAVTAFLADSITGPYVPVQQNPVLTHRQLGHEADITSIGHADLVQTQQGDWWAVMLGCRPINGNYYLGRETFLTPVKFEGYVPVFNPGKGRVLMRDNRPDLPWTPIQNHSVKDDFNEDSLKLCWNFLRTPYEKWYDLNDRKGWLKIDLRPEKITQKGNPSFIGRRMTSLHGMASTELQVDNLETNEEAGLVALQNENFQYQLILRNDSIVLLKVFNQNRKIHTEHVIQSFPYNRNKVFLAMKNDRMKLQFYFGNGENDVIPIGEIQDASVLSSTKSGGFIGAYVGMYASSNGMKSYNAAYFNYFELKKLPDEK